MKATNIKISLLVLFVLVILSFSFFTLAQESSSAASNVFLDSDQDGLSDQEEKTYGTDPHNSDTDGDGYSDGTEVKTGYDPLMPAPGDKIVKDEEKSTSDATTIDNTDKENLTANVSSQVSSIIKNADPDTEVSLDEIQSIVDGTFDAKAAQIELPEITADEIKIKKQNYKNLSAEKIEAKEKEDFMSYIVAVSYILSSNSPSPITSKDNLLSVFFNIGQQMVSAIDTRNPAALDSLTQSEQKILEQMKEVEVPEKLVDLHIKGLQLAKYAAGLKESLSPNAEDPLADVINLSKMQKFMDLSFSFFTEVQTKMTEYGLDYTGSVKDELTSIGVPDISNSANNSSSESSENSSQ